MPYADESKRREFERQYRETHRAKAAAYAKEYYHRRKNIDRKKRTLSAKRWAEANPEKRRAIEIRSRLKHKARYNDYQRNRRRTNINARLAHVLGARIKSAVNPASKRSSALALLGCSLPDFRIYLETRFEPEMSWDNYGKWHIDHIIPCALFDLAKPEHQKRCFHFSNMQPLWAAENVKKGNKICHL